LPASRALLASLAPPAAEAQIFGFYALCGKSAAIRGPIVFDTISHAAAETSGFGIAAIGAFFRDRARAAARLRKSAERQLRGVISHPSPAA
jgi:MFS-type transporter involved in bile tolerance (Atg22 family)